MPTEINLHDFIEQMREKPYGVLLCSSGLSADSFPEDYETLSWVGGLAESASINHWPKQGQFQLGFLSYDLKQPLHGLGNSFESSLDWPFMGWIIPQLYTRGNSDLDINDLFNYYHSTKWKSGGNPDFYPSITRETYLQKVESVRELIRKGTVYELNLCQAFETLDLPEDPINLFFQLRAARPVSFSALIKWEHRWLLSFSPERFLRKKGNKLTSQPIKGTIGRSPDQLKDLEAALQLEKSEKDRAENVMIVDLVRNDLAQVCEVGSVEVPDLMKVYSFPTVHQMISTVTGKVKQNESFENIIKSCFPMGSMTGAPKREAMIQIDLLEGFARNLFSGSVGYITDNGDFDLNVLIRSLYINEKTGKTSCFSGGAITYQSNAEDEYEESILKAEPLINMAGGNLVRS